jgi:hypothetical protein
MPQRLLNRDPMLGIKKQHLLQQIHRLLVHIGKERSERPLLDEGDLVQALLRHH